MKIIKIKEQELKEIASLLKALAEPTRLKIMQSLHEGELCVSDIVNEVGSGQANISKHLQLLVQNHLLQSRREGTTIYYRLSGSYVSKLCESICQGYAEIIHKKYGKKIK